MEEIYQDRKKFVGLVKEVVSADLKNFGLEVISYTIKDISDNDNYLSSLGKTKTAVVKSVKIILMLECQNS